MYEPDWWSASLLGDGDCVDQRDLPLDRKEFRAVRTGEHAIIYGMSTIDIHTTLYALARLLWKRQNMRLLYDIRILARSLFSTILLSSNYCSTCSPIHDASAGMGVSGFSGGFWDQSVPWRVHGPRQWEIASHWGCELREWRGWVQRGWRGLLWARHDGSLTGSRCVYVHINALNNVSGLPIKAY